MSSDGTHIAVGASDDYVYTSTDSGTNWTPTPQPGGNLAGSSDGAILIAGHTDGIYTSFNSGAAWIKSTMAAASSGTPFSVTSSADGKYVVAADANGGVHYSSDYGATWSPSSGAPVGPYWYAAAASADGSKVVVAAFGGAGIYSSTDYGATFTEDNPSGDKWVHALASSASGNKRAVAMGNYGTIWTSQPALEVPTSSTLDLTYVGGGNFLVTGMFGTITAK